MVRMKGIIKELKLFLEKNGKECCKNKCDEISLFVYFVFKKEGYCVNFIVGEFLNHPDGEYHVWVVVNGCPVDMTIQQFGDFNPGIIIKEIYDKNYKIITEEEIEEEEINACKLYQLYLEKK